MSTTKWVLTILVSTAIVAILGTASFTAVYFFIQNNADTPVTSLQAPQSVPLDANVIFDLVNQERIKAGAKPLIRDARLDATAQERADDMQLRNYEGHYDPVTLKNMVTIVHERQPGMCKYAGENIVKVDGTAEDYNYAVVINWLSSPTHKSFMLNTRFTLSGIAIKDSRVIQHFCEQ